MILFYDSETYCETPINAGTHRYAEDVEVMISSWAVDDGPVIITDHTAGEQGPFDLFDVDDFDEIVMHNSSFDRIVLRACGIADLPVENIHDTMVRAMSHGLPGGLDRLCSIFKVPEGLAKHKDGRALIMRFCKPRPKNEKVRRSTRETHPAEWAKLLSYAGGDIHSMRYLYKTLPKWNYPNREHALWCLDQKINDRGFLVDLELADAAIEMDGEIKAQINAETQDSTDGRVTSATKRDQMLQELVLQHGVWLPDLKGDTIERRLEDPDLPEPVKELLRQRLIISTTSTAKYRKIKGAVSSRDDRLRGSLLFCGAPRTKRWSGRVFQPQNLPRPDMKAEDVEAGIAALKLGLASTVVHDVNRLLWNAIRGLIIAAPGNKLVQADLSGIEARVLPWLAGEDWKLQGFRDQDAGGFDMYKQTAARLLGKPVGEVNKDERQSHGKVVELACGYGGAAGAFAQFAALYRVDMPLHEVMDAVRGWREAHPAIADWDEGFWASLDRAARNAIRSPGQTFEAGKHIRFERWRNWLRMQLPSGGFLSYASPAIIADPRREGKDTVSFMGINNYTRKWERLTTYGGKLSADATQSTARDILAHNLPWVDEKYPINLQVHDEVVTEVPDDPAYSVDDLISRLTRRPPWIDDKLPLAAGGFEAYRYRKDD